MDVIVIIIMIIIIAGEVHREGGMSSQVVSCFSAFDKWASTRAPSFPFKFCLEPVFGGSAHLRKVACFFRGAFLTRCLGPPHQPYFAREGG